MGASGVRPCLGMAGRALVRRSQATAMALGSVASREECYRGRQPVFRRERLFRGREPPITKISTRKTLQRAVAFFIATTSELVIHLKLN